MIIDMHTHVFPPDVIAKRDYFARIEPAFREVYPDRNGRIVTADDVLHIVNTTELDAAVICNFAWTDIGLIQDTNDYILDAARRSHGRLIPFCMIQPAAGRNHVRQEMARIAQSGACGIGELRPEQQGFSVTSDEIASILVSESEAYDLPLLFHVTEPVGHSYAGKSGLTMAAFAEFTSKHPGPKIIGAHWGGGLPFFRLIPEIQIILERIYVDTAASNLLYADEIFKTVADQAGHDMILFGSDYPLRNPAKEIARIRSLGLTAQQEASILGENAKRLLQL